MLPTSHKSVKNEKVRAFIGVLQKIKSYNHPNNSTTPQNFRECYNQGERERLS